MSRSYNRNIERLKANQSSVSQQEQQATTEAARLYGEKRIKDAQAWQKLTPFSEALQDWKKKDIEEKKRQGMLEARQAQLDKANKLSEYQQQLQAIEEARKMGELAFEFEDAKAQDTAYQQIKVEMLKTAGSDGYPDADRIAQLSPWQQVGFAQEKLRVFNNSFDDKLAHAMQNSERQIELAGITFTPAEIRDNNLSLPMKEAALQILAEEIRVNSNIDRFSPEMLKMSGTEEVIQKSKESMLAKYRQRYNIESSMNTRQRASLEWKRSEKTGSDLHRLLLQTSATIDTKGNILGNTGGWNEVMSILKQEGIAMHDPAYADKIGSYEIPDTLRRQIGAKPGTTYAQQWPARFSGLKRDIKKGYSDAIKAEETFLLADGKALSNEFITAAREGDLTTQEVNEYKRKFAQLGLPIPSGVEKYETASMRDEREDKQQIEALMAANRGQITHAELDQFHPKAALDYREKATKLETAAIQQFDAEKRIKASLDVNFANMGIKANEKSPAYVEALANAKADYARQYNDYVAMGYSAKVASHLALHGKPGDVKDLETGEPIVGAMGVITEIEANEMRSKYVKLGQSVEQEINPGHIRVARINTGKQEMRDDPNIIFTGTIGGDYGRRQLDSVKSNIEKYGVQKGLVMDKGALQFYKGLARGRDNNWMGLLDAQLKATGHEGLWPNGKPEIQMFMEGKDENGEDIMSSADENVRKAIVNAGRYPSKSTYIYQRNYMKDGSRDNFISAWDSQENLQPWVY
tara:strand:- start:4621 stop:6873 length:2253 start_codon:yes stop_codon:yes gene_type:complete